MTVADVSVMDVAPDVLPDFQSLVGSTRMCTRQVEPSDSVRAITGHGEEFARKPDVMASAELLKALERPCMEAQRPFLRDTDDSLGTYQHTRHRRGIAIGSWLTVIAQCSSALGIKTDWNVIAHDGFQVVARVQLGFAVVDHDRYERLLVIPKEEALMTALNTYQHVSGTDIAVVPNGSEEDLHHAYSEEWIPLVDGQIKINGVADDAIV